MTTGDIALVRERNVEFAVVCVRDDVLNSPSQRDQLVRSWSIHFGRPAVLIGARNHRSYGRADLVRFLRNVHPSQLPWRRMHLA